MGKSRLTIYQWNLIENLVLLAQSAVILASTTRPARSLPKPMRPYFSSDYHPARKIHGKAAPSWNYQVVHAQGPLGMKTDAIWLRRHLHKLTQINERQRDNPWKMGDAPKPFIDASIAAIVGMEVKLVSLIGKNQAGQQYKPETRDAIVNNLRAEKTPDTDAIAELIENTSSVHE